MITTRQIKFKDFTLFLTGLDSEFPMFKQGTLVVSFVLNFSMSLGFGYVVLGLIFCGWEFGHTKFIFPLLLIRVG